VQHVELFRSILTSEQKDGLFTTRMFVQEFGDVEDLPVDNDPAVFFGFVFSNFFQSVFCVDISFRFLLGLGLTGWLRLALLGRLLLRRLLGVIGDSVSVGVVVGVVVVVVVGSSGSVVGEVGDFEGRVLLFVPADLEGDVLGAWVDGEGLGDTPRLEFGAERESSLTRLRKRKLVGTEVGVVRVVGERGK